MTSPSQDSPAAPGGMLSANVELSVRGRRLMFSMQVPTSPARPRDLLPLFHSIADTMVSIGVEDAVSSGKTISCKKGCGACCRQYVPITRSEAHDIARLVEGLPEPRRSQIRQRFVDAIARLESSGMMHRLQTELQDLKGKQIPDLALDYFAMGIACPFLEEESCSIHEDRPISCRDYLVTSPAIHCANPSPQTVRMVPGPMGKAWRALAAIERASDTESILRLPLVLALDYAQSQPELPQRPRGADVLREFFSALTGKSGQNIPPAPGFGAAHNDAD